MTSEPAEEELLACQLEAWYPIFAKYTMRTVFLDLPDPEFLEFMNEDGLILPHGVKTSSAFLEKRSTLHDDSDDETSGENEGEDYEQQSEQLRVMKELSTRIEDAIQILGGSALPKLNWSAPKDATWVNGGTMECRRSGDVFLLLKSSDFISHDLNHLSSSAQIHCPKLALRRWANLHPSQEYRCFVRAGELVGICQRHHSEYWPHLSEEQHQTNVEDRVSSFHENTILTSTFPLSSYVFDVYMDKKDRVWLVDINVWGQQTDGLLFSWEELAEMDASRFDFRVVDRAVNVQAHPLSNYRAPVDVLDLASDSKQFREFMNMCERPSHSIE